MAYQRGALKKRRLKAGETWVLRYRVNRDDGRRVEKNFNIGLVRDFPRERDAWREVDRLGVIARVNDEEADPRIRFSPLAEHYLTNDCGPDALRPKTERTVLNTTHIVRAYLIPRWGNRSPTKSNLSTYRTGSKTAFKPRARLDDRFQDPWHHASDLPNRRPARACDAKSRPACRDAFNNCL